MQKHQDPVSVIVAFSVKPKYSLILTLGINRLLHNILQKKPSLELLRWHWDVCFEGSADFELLCQDARVQMFSSSGYASDHNKGLEVLFFLHRLRSRLFYMLWLFFSVNLYSWESAAGLCSENKSVHVCILLRLWQACLLIHTQRANLKLWFLSAHDGNYFEEPRGLWVIGIFHKHIAAQSFDMDNSATAK